MLARETRQRRWQVGQVGQVIVPARHLHSVLHRKPPGAPPRLAEARAEESVGLVVVGGWTPQPLPAEPGGSNQGCRWLGNGSKELRRAEDQCLSKL